MRMWMYFAPLLIVLAEACSPQPPVSRLIPREVLFGNPERAGARISPDGAQLAYLAPVNGVLNVWVRTLGMNDDRAIKADMQRGIRQFLWQSHQQQIIQ